MALVIRAACVALVAAISAVFSVSAQQGTPVSAGITLTTVPADVCFDPRPGGYLNFDLVVHNATAAELKVSELRAVVLNPAGNLIERKLVWQDALSVLGPAKSFAPGADGVLFNPLHFNAAKPGTRVRYEIDFGKAGSSAVTIAPRPCVTRAHLISPLAGRLMVYDGYDALAHHRRQTYYVRPDLKAFGLIDNWYRFAIDLVPVDAQGALFRGQGARMEDWFGWGMPVRAAGDGIVVAARDSIPDNDQVGSENRYVPKKLTEDEMETDGNYVLIDYGNGEMGLATHLRNGSARVKKGDRVKANQIVAEVGASGSAPVPHLHWELRTGWGVRGVRSLPPYFHDITVVGTGEGGAAPVPVNTGDVFVAR